MQGSPRTIYELFEATVARRGNQPALGKIASGAVHWQTWRDVLHDVDGVAQGLQERGIAEGDLCLADGGNASWITHDLASQRLGAFAVHEAISHEQIPQHCQIAAVLRTSGTGGEPRTVTLSHENLLSNTLAVAQTIAASLGDEDDGEELRLAFLPFHHLYARVCDLYCWIYRGSRMVLVESRETIFRDCKIAQPTTINGVPYFFQKAVDLADRQGVSLRELLGGRIKRCYSGGAALSPDIQRRFTDEDIPLMNGYGLSEASPVVTVSTVRDNKPGTVGKPLAGVDVRIAEDGEVLVQGPSIMLGYLNDPTATAQTIREGWLHTGDLGQFDADGFLRIVGRKKEMIALTTGKKVAPAEIEARLAASPWIEQVAVVGEGRSCLAALIVPNPDRVRAEVRQRRLWVWSRRRALSHPVVRQVFAEEISHLLQGCPSEQQVRTFRSLTAPSPQSAGK